VLRGYNEAMPDERFQEDPKVKGGGLSPPPFTLGSFFFKSLDVSG
jgi:hypothetical protein